MAGLIIHEWVEKSGGSEKVVEEFLNEFPDSELQVLWSDAPERFSATPRETWLAKTPLRRSKALALPLMPIVWRGLGSSAPPEWLLVSSHLFAHHARVRSRLDTPKLVYAHTPARYVWEPQLDARGASIPARLVSAGLKPMDRLRAKEADAIAANSEFTRQRIQRAWQRDATVIFPPVDTERITAEAAWRNRLNGEDEATLASLPNQFILGASRFVSYKRLELVIECGEANDLPVVLAGGGPDSDRLKSFADASAVPVIFVDRPSDNLLFALYQQSLAFVFPAIEDFGIMPVEAMATGTPVIVPAVGGAAESVQHLSGGAVFRANTPADWKQAVDEALKVDRAGLPDRTSSLSNSNFRRRIRAWLEQSLALSNL